MSSTTKRWAAAGALTALLVSGAALAAWGTHAARATIDLRIIERDGIDLEITVPSAVVNTLITVTPTGVFSEAADDLDELAAAMPFVREALSALEDVPDCTLVWVADADEFVRIKKEHARLVIEVEDRQDRVRVAVPISTVSTVMNKLARVPSERS